MDGPAGRFGPCFDVLQQPQNACALLDHRLRKVWVPAPVGSDGLPLSEAQYRGTSGQNVVAHVGAVVVGASEPGLSSVRTFLEDRRAERWVAGEPARPSESVTRAIQQFSPLSVRDDVWRRVRDLVESSVRRVERATVEPGAVGPDPPLTA